MDKEIQLENNSQILDDIVLENISAQVKTSKLRIKDRIDTFFSMKEKIKDITTGMHNLSGLILVSPFFLAAMVFIDKIFITNPADTHPFGVKIGFMIFMDLMMLIFLILAGTGIGNAFKLKFNWVKKLFFRSYNKSQENALKLEKEITDLVIQEKFQHEYLTDVMFLIRGYEEELKTVRSHNLAGNIAQMWTYRTSLINAFANNEVQESLEIIQKIEEINETIIHQFKREKNQNTNKNIFLERYNRYLEKNDLQGYFDSSVNHSAENKEKAIQNELKNVL